MPKLPILYIKPGCPWCDDALEYLAAEKIQVDIVDVRSDRQAMTDMIELSGQSKCPTLDWHGDVLADFGVDELIPFLATRQP